MPEIELTHHVSFYLYITAIVFVVYILRLIKTRRNFHVVLYDNVHIIVFMVAK